MAAAVMKVSGPFNMSSHQRLTGAAIPPSAAPSSRSKQPSHSSAPSSPPEATIKPGSSPMRPTFLQSIRSATRSRKSPTPAADDFATVYTRESKGKEKASSSASEDLPKEKSGMLRRLESKVNFRKPAKDSITPAPSPVPPPVEKDKNESKVRIAGSMSYMTPSLRLASMSSPALHLSSQALPSPKSQSAIPASSSSISEALVSPSRGRSRRASVKPTSSSNDGSSNIKPDSVTRHRSTKSSPINIPSASASELNLYSPPETPKRRTRDQPPSPPETPTPISGSRNQFGRSTTSSSSPSPSPIIPRNDSPIRARSPSNSRPRVVSPSHRGLSSASTSNLPSQDPSSPTSDSPRRPSFPREGTPSPVLSTRPRPVSPNQRAYSHNRHFNMSNVSLSAPSNPEHRELIRTATSMLCKEIVKPPAHMGRTESGQRDWEEVELRTRALARLERIWGKSGVSASSSNVNVNVLPMSSSGLSVAGEERERRLFTEALRDGFVLCQLMNKLRSSSVVRPDPREDGFLRTSNVTKFLAACASWGLSNEDLFQRDDLIEGTSESLARVAKTIIALIKFVDSPSADRSKFLSGQGKKTSNGDATGIVGESGSVVSGPYKLGSVSRSASTSTPNLVPTVQRRETLQVKTFVPSQTATTPTTPSPVPASPTRAKRWSPPSGLPTVRSDSSDEGSVPKTGDMTQNKAKPNFKDRRDEAALCHVDYDRDVKDVPRTLSPPPRSPLRTRSPKPSGPPNTVIDDNGQGLFTRTKSHSSHSHQSPRSFVTDSTRASVGGESARESYTDNNHIIRQSRASSAMTDMTTSTTTTVMSSLMDVGRGSSAAFSKFGTIRTITTEATSEAPSITRTEGSSIADEIARKRGSEPYSKDHKLSDAAVVDLTRVAEETEESGSSSRGKSRRTKDKGKSKDAEQESEPASAEKVEKSPIRLGKGKWPDDFLDVLHPPSISTHHNKSHTPTPEPEERLRTSSIISSSPPRKLAIVGASRRNESVESLPQFPRRPTHRARHSIDAPSGGSSLLPREAGMMRRDVSPGPDGLPSASSKVIIRRHNSKSSGPTRNGSYINGAQNSWSTDDPRDSDGDAAKVPFPRTVSADHTGSSTPRTPSVDDVSGVSAALDKAKPPRGRFQSDVEGTKRKARPSSYDELGVRPAARSRFESMVNLGVASSTASASDLMGRDSMDGSAVRKPLIIKEEGKLPTHFQLGNCIGRGQFGSVYRALNLNTGQMVAVKRIRLEGLKEEEVTQLMKEVDLVKRLSHPSIVKYEGMARDADTLSIVLEYAENGSLGQTLKAFGKLNERLVASYVVRILEGLHYLHQSDVVHCDLKAANILTTKNGNVKLSDFGVSLNMRAMEREIKDVAGTPNWMAPEVIELKGASPKSDIWSLACTVIELLTGRPPYGDIPNSMSVMFRIVEDDMPPIPPGCSPLLEDFLKQCFNKDPSKRPNADLLCEHQWLKQNWGAHKELRPQDSIPFLRRVSADLQKSEAVRYLSQIEMPDGHRADDPSSPTGRRISNTSMRPSLDNNEISPREHSFVKTTFSKPMICRVCLLNVKKNNAPPTCDLRAQLLLYAQYAEKGNPSSVYSNPVDLLNEPHPKSPMSDVPYVLHSTPRTSLDSSPPPQSPTQTAIPHPPTAFKFFKRSRTSQPGETPTISISSSPPNQENAPHPRKLTRRSERPQSLGSNSTNPENSMRSTSSAGQRSTLSNDMAVITETDSVRASRITSNSGVSDGGAHIPGSLPEDNRRHKKNKSSGNCIVQ
ncbi:cell division control protein [Moniliophthora roreri MCA 2997]|uniref:Cell division control protein n=1 Tax=Moniliophthora roreri (strain MCA 2997) TaxID=1381753 RepID=V2XRX8_MONRO|nr:cell division control protein [Moniliophthora roreri MCA 2997]